MAVYMSWGAGAECTKTGVAGHHHPTCTTHQSHSSSDSQMGRIHRRAAAHKRTVVEAVLFRLAEEVS